MSEPARESEPELTAAERAELRRLLRLLRKASVDARPIAKVEPSPKLDVATIVSRRRRRKGL